ncbi:MAG: protease pro-enzyme activation domain-containing protein, partial [Terriglobales bacterium]
MMVWLGLTAGLAAQAARPPVRLTQAINDQQLVRLGGNVHPLARAQFDRGPAAAGMPLQRMLLLLQRSPQQELALRQLLVDQQTPGSPQYHRWLTPQQFGAQYGPAPADIQTVGRWLTAQGLSVDRVAPGGNVIEFSGTAGAVAAGFHTEIHRYVVAGATHWANASDPAIPAALTPAVAGVVSLNN